MPETTTTFLSKDIFSDSSFQVCADARLILEFMYDDYMRIKSWHMAVKTHRELIPRSVIGMHAHSSNPDPTILEQISKNITRSGITNSTLNYLRVSGDILIPNNSNYCKFLCNFVWFHLIFPTCKFS